MRSMKTLVTLAALLAMAGAANAAATYTQNFDSMGTSGTTMPAGWSVYTLPTDHATFTTGVPIVMGAGTLGNQTLLTYQQGAAGTKDADQAYNMGNPTDRSLGSSPTSIGAIVLQLALQNDTGTAATSMSVSYDLDMWRVGDPEQLYGYAVFYDAGAGWTAAPALYLTGAGTASAAINFGAPVPVGGTIKLRWADDNSTGGSYDDMIAVDNVSITLVPEPATMSLLAMGGLALLRRRRK